MVIQAGNKVIETSSETSHFLRSYYTPGMPYHWSFHSNLLSNYILMSNNKSITSAFICSGIFYCSFILSRGAFTPDVASMWQLLWLATLFLHARSELHCNAVLKKCKMSFKECVPMLWRVFGENCSSALGYDPIYRRINGAMQEKCPINCVKAIQDLTSSRWGKDVESCTCPLGDGYCLTLKARMKRCVQMNEKDFAIISCTEARKNCTADRNCDKTQRRFLRRCNHLISGVNCTQDCKRAQDELLSSDLGKVLYDCECDGEEEHYCRAIRAHYEALCKANRTPREKMNVARQQGNEGHKFSEVSEWILCAVVIIHVYVLRNR